ncbi:MAG: glycosyltransferase [Pyrinomonadaceae bacterium MAG19_C2-C3]|nr:glycosyltransferase [Pyrinomonadaceae bacterium MAG19_C2-C3]
MIFLFVLTALTALIWACLALYLCGALILLYGLHRPAKAESRSTPFVSVVIAARNEAANLPALLEDLQAQTYTRFEVIIVDDRSTDETANIVEAWINLNPKEFRLVRQSVVPSGVSPKKLALQSGVEASLGEIVLLTDADNRVMPSWIEGMTRAFMPDVAMVLGFTELTTDDGSTMFERWQAFEFLTLVAGMAASANLNHALGASGQNIAYRRSMFDTVGGYTKIFHRIAGDDMLMLELVKHRPHLGRVVYADDAGTRNRSFPKQTMREFRQQRARWAASGTHHFRGDKLFMLYAVGSLVVNMAVLFGAVWAAVGWLSWTTWAMAAWLKFVADAVFYGAALKRFNRLALIKYLPLWFVTQPIYLLAMAVWGQRQKFTWKPEHQ